MPLLPTCPPDAEIEEFLGGRLVGETAAQLQFHLDACPGCLARVAKQSPSGPVLEALRRTHQPVKRPPPELIKRLEMLFTGRTTTGFATHGGLPAGDEAEEDEPPDWIAHYRILHQLGAGGMGVVYCVEDTQLRRQVALKVLSRRAARDARARDRFLREARAVAALNHDHIVTIFQVGEIPSANGSVPLLYLAMELLEGEGLDHWMARYPCPPLPTAIRIARQAAAGLAAAHDCGVIHGDVKPANLWLASRSRPAAPRTQQLPSPLPAEVRVKLLDFGLAIAANDANEDDRLMGTPAYMAPEQIGRTTPDSRTDVFGLGCVLYELCTGHHPFPDRHHRNLSYTPPAPLSDRNADLPPALSDLVMRMLAEDPNDRPPSAADIEPPLAALEEALARGAATEALSAADTLTLPPPARPATRRSRWLAGGGMALAAVLMAVWFLRPGAALPDHAGDSGPTLPNRSSDPPSLPQTSDHASESGSTPSAPVAAKAEDEPTKEMIDRFRKEVMEHSRKQTLRPPSRPKPNAPER